MCGGRAPIQVARIMRRGEGVLVLAAPAGDAEEVVVDEAGL